jgi:hypothetical protein
LAPSCTRGDAASRAAGAVSPSSVRRRRDLVRSADRAALLAGAAAAALLLAHTACWRAKTDLTNLTAPRRYWEDMAAAATRFLDDGTAEPFHLNSADGAEIRIGFQRSLTRGAAEAELRSWQFWRTLPIRPLLKGRRLLQRDTDDPGRAGLLAMGFRLLRGVAPFLPLWLGPLMAAPVLAWAAWELGRSGYPLAGAAFALLVACSPFVVDALTLPYSAVGFYVIGLVVLVAVAGHAVSPDVRWRGLAARALAAGAIFGVCVLCRSGTLFLLPGYGLAFAAGAWRLPAAASAPRRWPRRALGALALLALFLLPYVLVREPKHHEIWLGMWEGLGDFDRTKGHAWNDDVAREVLRRAGAAPAERYPVWEDAPQNEPLFRRLFLEDVRDSPAWYAAILGRRLWATLAQSKLAPWPPLDGLSIAPSTTAGEGVIDSYYALTTPVDSMGVGPRRFELPLPLLWGPTLVLVVVAALGPRSAALRPSAARARPALWVLACVAAAGLGLPVLFTTAGAVETQAFALVYLLGWAFLLDAAVRYASTRAAGLPAG